MSVSSLKALQKPALNLSMDAPSEAEIGGPQPGGKLVIRLLQGGGDHDKVA